MPQLNFDNNNQMGVQPEVVPVDTQTDTLPVGTQADVPTVSTVVTHNDNDIPEAALWIEEGEEKAVAGLTADELNDPNKIQVNISDPNAPLLVLFGPPACGKTMTLVRLARYLKQNGYTIAPVRTFRPNYDSNYERLCNDFDTMINRPDAAASTSNISFMLVEVMRNGRRLCQILEAPGEFYFNPKEPNAPFPTYVNAIINSNNRKIWAFMLEPDWMNATERQQYVDRIHKLKLRLRARDKIMFVLNKIDRTNFMRGQGKVNVAAAYKQVTYDYPGLFTPFRNPVPVYNLIRPDLFDFVPFQTGDYAVASDGTQMFQEGPDEFPRQLWKVLLNRIRG